MYIQIPEDWPQNKLTPRGISKQKGKHVTENKSHNAH